MPIASTQRQESGCTPHWRRLIGALYLQCRIPGWVHPSRGHGGWSVLPWEDGWSSGTVAGDGSRLHRLRTED